jgi:hypothetical protein
LQTSVYLLHRHLSQAATGRQKPVGAASPVLWWPATNASLTAAYALTVLALWKDSDPSKEGIGLCPPKGLRALLYPWSTRVRLPLDNVYVSKEWVVETHLKHLQSVETSGDEAVRGLHTTLIRVRDLNGRAVDGERHVELLNPNLGELFPSGPCNPKHSGQRGLLHRVRSKTQLRNLSRSPKTDWRRSPGQIRKSLLAGNVRERNPMRRCEAQIISLESNSRAFGYDKLGLRSAHEPN